MAASSKNNPGRTGAAKKDLLIDPVYQKYTKSVIRALGSTEFYEFFMDAVSRAENQFQFSNRKMEKTVDLHWVDTIEDSLPAIQSIISNPRNIIKEEELIVNVANAKKAGADVVRHLSQHASLVEKYDFETGDVRPSKLMQKYREDSTGLYENRLVFTAMEAAYQFVKIRHDAIFSAMSDEFGAKLKVDSTMETATEMVHLDMFMHIKETDSAIETDDKNQDVFARISRIYRVLSVLMQSQFAQQMAKLQRVRGAITKTNVLKKNPNYRKIMALLEFLRSYDDIGYTIKVVEQNPEINETMQRDIYHNILFNYLILKGYLEDERDRIIPAPSKAKKRALKPKFVKEIIEELTEDYDLPDVEIRKVLIEELTKEQLMAEEAEERRRLVEEQERRKKEEQERLKKEAEAEKERIRKEKEAEKERIRQEKEAEEKRLKMERMEREAEDRRRCKLFRAELDFFEQNLEKNQEDRQAAVARRIEEIKAFEEAQRLIEEEKQRKIEEEARIQREKEEEEQRLQKIRVEKEAEEARRCELIKNEADNFVGKLDQNLEKRRAASEKWIREKEAFEESARLTAEAEERRRLAEEQERRRREEAEQLKKEAEAEKERLRKEKEDKKERIRLEKEAEDERIRLEEELAKEAARAEEERRKEQEERDTAYTKPYLEEVVIFMDSLSGRLALREAENRKMREEKERRELERQRRLAAKAARK